MFLSNPQIVFQRTFVLVASEQSIVAVEMEDDFDNKATKYLITWNFGDTLI